MLEDKNIKNKFNNPSLDNEDWLQPSDSVFMNISEELFPEKKKKRFFLFWFGLFCVLSFSGLLAYTILNGQFGANNIEANKNAISQPIEQSPNYKDQATTTESKNEIVVSSQPDSKNNSSKSTSILEKNNSSLQELVPNNIIESKAFVFNNYRIDKNQLQENFSTINTNSLDNIVNIKKTLFDINGPTQLPSLDNLVSLQYSQLQLPIRQLQLLLDKQLSNQLQTNYRKSHLFLSSGYSLWNLKLNENYNTALSPADFRHSKGKGFVINLGYQKTIKPTFKVQADIAYESVILESGHNSEIEYDTNIEIDNENAFDLTMASPLGFISSSVVVQRSNQGPIGQIYDLTIDLSNRHKVQNINFNVSGIQQIISYKDFTSHFQFGMGLSQIVQLENELYNVSIASQDFMSNDETIIRDQENINRTRFNYSIGFSLEQVIRPSLNLVVNYSMRRNLSVIHKVNDFNTQLIKQHLSLGLIHGF